MKKAFLIAVIILTIPFVGISQDSITVVLKNPQKTVESHLKYLQQENFNPKLAIQTFNWEGTNITQSQKEKIAIYTKELLSGGYFDFELDKISDKKDIIGFSIKFNKIFSINFMCL